MTAPVDAIASGMRGHTAAGVQDVQLPAFVAAIRCNQGFDDITGAAAFAQQLQAVDAVIRIDQRLRRDAAEAGGDMWHACADREETCRYRYTELAGHVVAGDDRPGHLGSLSTGRV